MPDIRDSVTQDSIIADTVVIGDSSRVKCNACKTEGNITFFKCKEKECESTFCEYCESNSKKLCNFHYIKLSKKEKDDEFKRKKKRAKIASDIQISQENRMQNTLLGLFVLIITGLFSDWFWIETVLPFYYFNICWPFYLLLIFTIFYKISNAFLQKYR